MADRRLPLDRIRAALTDGGYEGGLRSSRPGRRYGVVSTGQLVPLMAGDVVALCASIREPDQKCRELAKGCACVGPDAIVRLESDDVCHLVELAGKATAVSMAPLPGGTVLAPESVKDE